MHELSIAEALVSVAERHAAGRRVTAVEVKVGRLRQVVPSALEFAFELVAQDTVIEGAELRLEVIAAEGRCRDCGSESVMEQFPLACRQCRGLNVDVVAGEELLVDVLEMDENDLASVPNRSEELTTIGGRR